VSEKYIASIFMVIWLPSSVGFLLGLLFDREDGGDMFP
jgi:hypothetical protein